jgi:hypothetical protein
MPGDRNLLSLDASLAIPTRVLRFEASPRQRPGRSDHPPGRLDRPGQSDRPRRSDRPSWAVEPAWVAATPRWVFGLNFVAEPSNPVVFWWTTANPANSVYPPPISTHDLAPMLSRLDLGFEALPRNCPRLRPAVLATMRPAPDSAGHRVPWTKPTCLLHTWRPHWRRPFVLVLHLHQQQSSRNLHLQYLTKSQSTQRCQSLITQRSDHPPVLEPHMVLSWHQNERKHCHPQIGSISYSSAAFFYRCASWRRMHFILSFWSASLILSKLILIVFAAIFFSNSLLIATLWDCLMLVATIASTPSILVKPQWNHLLSFVTKFICDVIKHHNSYHKHDSSL